MLQQRRRGRADGFTLVELMAVVTIIAVMGYVAMATMSRAGGAQNSAALARTLQFAMAGARTAALSDGFQHRLRCSPQPIGSYCVVEKAAPAGMAAPASWTSESRLTASNHALIWTVTSSTDVAQQSPAQSTATQSITFYPDGSSDPTGKTVYVADSSNTTSNHYKVYVYSATGMARLVSQW
jgi:prepilin-type N-terminal cleavage/methylation domain-containing protein